MQINYDILFAFFGTLIGTFGGIYTGSKLTAYRIEQLEKKVEKHNGLIERTYDLEARADVLEQKISVEQHRMDDAEKAIDKTNERILNLTRRN